MISEMTSLQAGAFEKFARLKVGAVFLKQGAGKTRIAVELANYNTARLDLVVFVTAFSVKHTLASEAEKWGLQLPFTVVGHETLSGSDRVFLEVLDSLKGRRVMLVVDESIFVKNPETVRHSRVAQIRSKCDYALLLNGSPVTRDVWDIYWQFNLLSPQIINQSTGQFERNYFTRVAYRKHGGDVHEFRKLYQPNVAHLTSLIEPYMIAGDFSFAHEVHEKVHVHGYSESARMAYLEKRLEALRLYARDGGGDAVKWLTELNHVANNDPAKWDSIAGMIGGKCIVYTPWLAEQDEIASRLDGAFLLNGNMCGEARAEIIREWEKSDSPLVATYGVGAYGLNLQSASTVHFASLTFDYGHMDHAKARVRRLGQKGDVYLHYHASSHQISQTITDNLGRKNWLADAIRSGMDFKELV